MSAPHGSADWIIEKVRAKPDTWALARTRRVVQANGDTWHYTLGGLILVRAASRAHWHGAWRVYALAPGMGEEIRTHDGGSYRIAAVVAGADTRPALLARLRALGYGARRYDETRAEAA